MKLAGHLASLACVVVAGFSAYACGSDAEGDSSFPDGGGASSSSSGTLGEGGPGEGGSSSGNPDSGVDMCGGKPCANFMGPKEFSEQGAPGNAPALFGATPKPNGTDPAKEPRILYPNHETMFPINVSHIRHEWSQQQNDLFRLTFEGPKTKVTIYTTNKEWEPSEDQWDWIAESNRGATVKLTVAGILQASPQDVWQSQTIDIHFSASEVEGALYYWSTGSAGIMKALVSDRVPVKFYTDPLAADKGTCVACHTLSRDGKRLVAGYGGEKLKEVSVPARTAILPATGNPTRDCGWSTFSPDGKMLLVASKGVLTLIDSDTGNPIGPNNGIVPLNGKLATHPDWAALGDKVVVSLATKIGNKDMEGGAIATIPYNGGAWGAPTIIVGTPGAAGDNNFFPVFSPDSKWIAYVNAKASSKDEVTSTLRLVATTGGNPVDMVRLNQRVNNADGVINLGNSMPTWAPATKPGVFWLAFSSLRAYSSLRPQDGKLDQIWIAAIDPSKPDPGYSAFWAPFQSMPEGNHRAFWTHVEGDKQCRCVEICGDGIDNNCNGVADEQPCSTCAAQEICGNGIDDNCDCVVDNCGGTDPDPIK